MEQHNELREMFGLPRMPKEVADSIGLEFDDFIDDVALPMRPRRTKQLLKREKMGKMEPHKPRGISFTSENNPQQERWICLQCDMESNITGILRHHRTSGHIGKQRKRLLG